jgi:hypothetical protein
MMVLEYCKKCGEHKEHHVLDLMKHPDKGNVAILAVECTGCRDIWEVEYAESAEPAKPAKHAEPE